VSKWTRIWFGGWSLLLSWMLATDDWPIFGSPDGLTWFGLPFLRRVSAVSDKELSGFNDLVAILLFVVGLWLVVPVLVAGIGPRFKRRRAPAVPRIPLTFEDFKVRCFECRELMRELETAKLSLQEQASRASEMERGRASVIEKLVSHGDWQVESEDHFAMIRWADNRQKIARLQDSIGILEKKLNDSLADFGQSRTGCS